MFKLRTMVEDAEARLDELIDLDAPMSPLSRFGMIHASLGSGVSCAARAWTRFRSSSTLSWEADLVGPALRKRQWSRSTTSVNDKDSP